MPREIQPRPQHVQAVRPIAGEFRPIGDFGPEWPPALTSLSGRPLSQRPRPFLTVVHPQWPPMLRSLRSKPRRSLRRVELSARVLTIQSTKPYPRNYVPPWMQRYAARRARMIEAQLRIHKMTEVAEGADRPPAEKEGIIHQGVEKALHVLAFVIAALLTAVAKTGRAHP